MSENKKSEEKTIIISQAHSIPRDKFPSAPENIIEKEKQNKIIEKIQEGGISLNDGRTFIQGKSLPYILCTTKKNVNKFINKQNDSDIYSSGEKEYVSTQAVKAEINKKIEEPRTTSERERLKYADLCLNVLRDNPDAEKQRQINCENIQRQLPNQTKKLIKKRNIVNSELTNTPMQNPEGHHIIDKATEPRLALEPDNIIVIDREEHKRIHRRGAESKEDLKKLADEENWNTSNLKF